MSTVVIQYRIKGERTEEPVHTFEINSSSNEGDSGVSLHDMKRRVTEDNSITKWLIPTMRVFNQGGEQPESGMVGPGEIYTVVLEAVSPELEGALPCFTPAEVGDVHVPRLEDPKDGLFLSSLIRHTLDDAEKWYADMEELDSIRVALDSLIHGLCTLAKVTDNIRVLIGEGDTEFVPLLCRGFRFISDAFLSTSEQQKPTASDIFIHYLHLFSVLTPSQLAWAEPGPDIKERFDPIFSTVTKLILNQEENSFFGSVLDVIKVLGKESCTKGDLKVVKECMWTLGALADRNMAVLEALGSDKGRPLFEVFKSLLSDSRGSTSTDADIKGMLFEMKQNLVQLVMLGSEYSMTFSKRADEFGMFAAVREAIFWTVEAFSSPDSNSADPNCDNEGYIIEVIGKARGGPCDDKEEREAEASSKELRKLINTVKFISFRDTPRSRAFTSFLMAELFDAAKMPSKVKSIIEESPGLQYTFLDMLIEYIEDGKPQRANNVFTQEFLHTLFSPFFMQIGSEIDEKTGETFLSTKRRFVRLRQKTCEFILLASYMTKEARNLVLADLHKIATETKVADLFVIPSEIMTSMFSRFACSEEIQTLKSEDIFELINIVLPIYRENARRKGAILGNTPFKCVQMRYESSRCILMNSCFLLLKNPVMLPKIIENEGIINFFFDMLRDTGTQTFSLSCIGKLLSAPMESCEQAMTRKNVCEKFLACVRTFIRENTLDEFEMELQLLRAIGEVCLAGKKYQRLMITSGVFSVITSLLVLPIEGHQERKDKLVEECLGALYYVLIGCEKNKNSFRKNVGYNSFTDTLKRVVGSITDQRIVTNKLFDMLVETRIKWGAEGSGDVIPTIRNPQILFVILDLCGSLKTDVAAHALTRVIEVLGSMPNRNICCKNGVLAHLLNMIDYYSSCSEQAESAMVGKEISFSMRINTLAIEIIHILGSHTLSAGELKHIIRILSFSGPSKTRLPDFPYLIYALHQMPSSISSPETYFGFNGISSKFILPKLDKGIFSKGLTVNMWIRVESYKKPVIDVGYEEAFVAPSNYNPVLLSLNGPDNQKIEVYLQDKMLAIRAASPDGALSSTFGTYCVPEQQWTCVGIIISSTSLIGFRSTLYINGTQVEKVNSKYQRYGNFTNNMLGGSYVDPKQTFFGQIGCFNVFGDTLSQSQMKAIFEVGPNYLGLFNEEEMKGSTTSGGSFGDDHILSYNARTQKGKFILNSCVVNSSSSAKIKNVETCIVTKIKDVIGCTEGIQVLFPLVLMLNKPSHPEFTSPYTDQQLLIYIIELINDLVTSSKEVGDDMIRNKGYTVLSHILKKIPSSCFSPELVRFLEKSYRCMNRNHELQKCFISDFVTDFSLWIYTPVETQLELFTMLREMHSAGRKKVPVWLNLSILQMFYWTRSENKEWCMCTAPRINPATKFVNGARPPEAKIEEIRRIQYETLRVQLENNDFDKDDIQSLLAFLCLEVSDIKGTIGVLRAINAFFSPTSQTFADKFYDEGGLGVLVRMLSTDSDDLLLTLVNSIQTLVSVLSSSPQFSDRVHGLAMAMYEALSQHIKMTLSVYKMLLGMCITDNPTPFAGSNWQDNYVLEYPEFLCHCVLRLSAAAEEPIRIAAIHDVCLLLERPANVERLILFPGWQSALVDIIMAQLASSADLCRPDAPRGTPEVACPAGATEGGDQDGNDELGCARSSTFDVMCTILCTIGFTVITGPSEWRSFENLLSALQTAELKNGNLTNIMYYMKIRFYRALTESFRPRAGMSDGMGALYKRGTPQFQKACYAIVFIIDDIFAMHSNNPLSDSEDVCAILLNIVDYMSVSHITCAREWCGCDKPKPGASVVGASLALRNGGFAGLFIFACVNVVKLKCATSTRLGITGLHKAVDCMCKYCEETLPGFFGAFSDDFYYVVLFLMRTHDRLRETDESEYFTSVVNLVVGSFVKRRIKKFADETTTFLNKALASVADSTSHGGENEYLATAISADEGIKKKAHRFRNDVLRRNVAVGLKANTAFTESNRMCVARVAEAEAHLLQEATAATAALVEERKAQGTKRLQQLCRALREVNAEAAHKWRKIIRSLSSGKGPWGTAEAIVNWKLDETENSSRMRIKMKRNYSFDMHEGAAVATRNRQPSAPPAPTMRFATEVSAAKDAWMMLSTTGLSKKASKARKGADTGAYYEDEDVVVDDEEIEKHEDEKKTLYETECNVIRPGKIYTGTLTIKKDGMLFVEGTESKSKVTKRAKKMFWRAEMIREVHFRRYMLVHTALEIFFDDSTNVFLNFGTVKIKEAVHRAIVKGVEPPNLAYSDSKTSQEILESSGLTEQWVNGEMSNFDYLMKLNTIAGRTYNDLRQYPVFPWIIADYTSKELDFNNPGTFRDLSKPVGALNPKRLETFRQRYENFCDPNVPPFMYATHYSSADTTFFYLLRVEPFTSYYVKHLRGRFDLADRMFGSIAKTWHNCLHGNSDIKELIPEFFYFPEFLRNANKFDFGETQAGVKLDDVVLPPWAHNSPEEFIRMNRAALESPYVSQHLHEWIDLIFGYKQRGKAAEEANNIFCFFTYEGAVDIDKIDNEIDRIAMRDQIANFGQTPAQLLTKPHPQRKVLPAATTPVTPSFLHNDFFVHLNESYKMGSIVACNSPASCNSGNKKIVFVATPESVITDLAFSFISNNPNRLITVDCLYNIYTTVNPDNLFLLSEFDAGSDGETGTNSDNVDNDGTKDPHGLTRDNFTIEKVQRVHGIKDDVSNDNFFSLTENGAFMLCCGFWDNSFRILGLEDDSIGDAAAPSVMQKVCKHKDLVTCIRFDEYTGVVATGSRDTSIMLWNVTDNNPMRVHERPFNVLYGHNDEIVSLDINAELDIVASCARDGCLMVHTIRSGGFVWSAQVSEPGCPSMLVKISPNGNIVVCVPHRSEIFVYNVNGRLLSSQKYECETKTSLEGGKDEEGGSRDTINAMKVILGGDALVTCGDKRLCFWRLCDMKICFSMELEAPAYCVHVSNNETFYYVGLKNGKVLVLKV